MITNKVQSYIKQFFFCSKKIKKSLVKLKIARTLQIHLKPPILDFFQIFCFGVFNMSFRPKKCKKTKKSFLKPNHPSGQ